MHIPRWRFDHTGSDPPGATSRWFFIPTTNILLFGASDLREVRIQLLSRLWVRIVSHCELDMNMGSMF